MTEPRKLGSRFRISIDDGTGNFVPIEPIRRPILIRCVPTPSKDGFHYVPDWYGLTTFG